MKLLKFLQIKKLNVPILKHADIFAESHDQDGKPDGTFGPIDPTNEANYGFLTTLFTEVTKRFVDHYLHLGGDEKQYYKLLP
ncbi:hypothetical protein SK128_002483 [Halocaridina rubra]|uniref:beta-N-acetylhexosaminidase n=1 Tax=Halocaridina rubra TaxID=373956 RepID=A0AAN8XSC7_HALRR